MPSAAPPTLESNGIVEALGVEHVCVLSDRAVSQRPSRRGSADRCRLRHGRGDGVAGSAHCGASGVIVDWGHPLTVVEDGVGARPRGLPGVHAPPRCGGSQLVPNQEIPQRGVVRSPEGLGHARQLVPGVHSGRIREPHTQGARQQRRGHGRSARQRYAAGMGHRPRPLGQGLAVRRPVDRVPRRARSSRPVITSSRGGLLQTFSSRDTPIRIWSRSHPQAVAPSEPASDSSLRARSNQSGSPQEAAPQTDHPVHDLWVGSLCQGSPQAGRAGPSESSGCSSSLGSSSSGPSEPTSGTAVTDPSGS